jgi:guanosine-3',5'-bis(diphosphate) 3'-pyrophosphohydrolase
MVRQFELVEKIKSYDPTADEDLINRAYVFSMKAHGSQTRASGDPYFIHPLEVAWILTDMKLDTATITTALLHDTVEDTVATIEEIRQTFNDEIASLVDGITKLSRIELQHDPTVKQAENFRKLVLAMSTDIRILLVKLADRLHNMRTLKHIKNPEKRRRIATETLEIYAPLAERIGMQRMKTELEELAFAEVNPEARQSVVERCLFLNTEGKTLIQEIIEDISHKLATNGIQASVIGRDKTPYSIWRKMVNKNAGFDQLGDIIGFRVITNAINEVYQALGVLHNAYPMIPGRFKDYISTPKPNGYRSLHTGIIGPKRQRIEVQIRTHDMDRVAEIGVAAHWEYKSGVRSTDAPQYRWLRGLLDILEHTSAPDEFLEHTKMEMFQDQVFCFSPKGDIIALPRGATPIDFAYAVHSQIGDRCIGAKVNGRPIPLKTTLNTGDQVEIITSEQQRPMPVWESYAATGKARARVRRYVRSQRRHQYVNLGRSILRKVLTAQNYPFDEIQLSQVLKQFQLPELEDLYIAISEGQVNVLDVIYNLYPDSSASLNLSPDATHHDLPIKGLIPGMALHFAECCYPLPGDRIIGRVTKGQGLVVHTVNCDATNARDYQPQGWIRLAWTDSADKQGVYLAQLMIRLENEIGTLAKVTQIIAQDQSNITNIKIMNRNENFFEFFIALEVRDTKHLDNIIAHLRSAPTVNHVERVREAIAL